MKKFRTAETVGGEVKGKEVAGKTEPPLMSYTQFIKLQRHPVPRLDTMLEQELINTYDQAPEKRSLVLAVGTIEVWLIKGHAYYLEENEARVKAKIEWYSKRILYPHQLPPDFEL